MRLPAGNGGSHAPFPARFAGHGGAPLQPGEDGDGDAERAVRARVAVEHLSTLRALIALTASTPSASALDGPAIEALREVANLTASAGRQAGARSDARGNGARGGAPGGDWARAPLPELWRRHDERFGEPRHTLRFGVGPFGGMVLPMPPPPRPPRLPGADGRAASKGPATFVEAIERGMQTEQGAAWDHLRWAHATRASANAAPGPQAQPDPAA